MNIVFMGTPDFAVPSLKILIEEFNVSAVFTQPDRKKGRGKKLAITPVKEIALENNVPVYQPVKLRTDEECIKALRDLKPDFIVVVAFGQILSKEVLDIPKYGCINLHGSLLPKYRGSAPIQHSIIMGEKVSGNTTMLMDVGIDTGDMLLKDQVEVKEDMTSGELYDILKNKGADLLVDTLKKYSKGEITPIKQEDDKSTHASMLNKDMAKIDWSKTSEEIHNLIRGLNPWPVAYTSYKDENMKIYKSKVLNKESTKSPGTIINVNKEGIEISCGKGVILLEVIQFPNGKPLSVAQYINGHSIEEQEILK